MRSERQSSTMNVLLEVLFLLVRVTYYCMEAFLRIFLPPTPKDITGQVVLVTGAGMGIGRQMAFKFAAQRARLAVLDINEEAVEETAAEIVRRGGTAHAYVCDVTSTDSIKQAATKVREHLGEVDILVNNAGILLGKQLLDFEEREMRKTMEVNTMAHFWTVREFLPNMLKKNAGHIVTIASMAAKGGTPFLTDYCASKFGAYGFTEAVAAEVRYLGKDGIRTTTVCPMFVNTALAVGNLAGRLEIKDRFGKLLDPEDVAQTVVEGVLKDATHLIIPASNKTVDLLTLMPRKAALALVDFMGVQFVPAKKNM